VAARFGMPSTLPDSRPGCTSTVLERHLGAPPDAAGVATDGLAASVDSTTRDIRWPDNV